ncbi:plastocyanin/azurin family copper-binding protein [Thioalkalivibrio sp. ALMg9]|uniref:plastocyanin/azurin family copper-binding protein n=1 Tax=Thioalkalivibrio sp. ALMg9 TaxID=1266912 RepID=UPI00037B1B55|nr:plastocyanin/azurin family copper-binding protein [Thioalkalivibrio sp. ALMg9]
MKRPESAYPSAIGRNPLGAHFAAGLAVVLLWYFASVAQASMGPDFSELFGNSDFIEIIERDEGLETRPTGYVSQEAEPDHVFRIDLDEGQVPIGQGVVYDGFLIDGKLPGPTLRVTEGDIVRMEISNSGDVMHGASIHAAYTQTSKHVGHILPGQTKSITFRATTPGVFMYHCAPGGHAIPMHVMFGQYGMIVVEPRDEPYKLEADLGQEPDLKLYMLQHELYASGKEAVEGDASYTAFNGQLFRYVENPIPVRPGDYVRMYFLNVGPNLLSTFHIVGIVWDYVYWQGHPEALWPGGQTVTTGPSDSWVIEFRIPPEEGVYTMLDHGVGATSRGAIGLLDARADADTPAAILAEGPVYESEERVERISEARRILSPFGIPEVEANPIPARADRPVRFGADVDEVVIEMKGNSFYPKSVEVAPGTKVTWVNEDVFTYGLGETSGAHNAVAMRGPQSFSTAMLEHAESDSVTLTEPGTYDYICAPHPYMQGRIVVRDPD